MDEADSVRERNSLQRLLARPGRGRDPRHADLQLALRGRAGAGTAGLSSQLAAWQLGTNSSVASWAGSQASLDWGGARSEASQVRSVADSLARARSDVSQARDSLARARCDTDWELDSLAGSMAASVMSGVASRASTSGRSLACSEASLASTSVRSLASRSEASRVDSLHSLWPTVSGKRKLALSDSEEEEEERWGAKRPRSPTVTHSSPRPGRLTGLVCSLLAWLARLLGLVLALLVVVLALAWHRNTQCGEQQSQQLPGPGALAAQLESQLFGQSEAVAVLSSAVGAGRAGGVTTLLLAGGVGTGKTHTARLLAQLLPTHHSHHFHACSLLTATTAARLPASLAHQCGWSLLVLDDCHLEQAELAGRLVELVTALGEAGGRGRGVVVVVTTPVLHPAPALLAGLKAVVVPYKPLTRPSVARCLARLAGPALTPATSQAVLDSLTWRAGLAVTGCKQLASRLDLVRGGEL